MTKKYNIKSLRLLVLLILLALTGQMVFADNGVDEAKKYLKKQITQNIEILISSNKQDILNADVISSDVGFDIVKDSSRSIIAKKLFLIYNGEINSFYDELELVKSDKFIKAINPKFRLKTDNDANQFGSMLYALRYGNIGKIFREDNKWCFINGKWFGKLEYYEVSTNDKNIITSIDYISKEMETPENAKPFDLDFSYLEKIEEKLDKKYKKLIKKELKKDFPSCTFDVVPMEIKNLKSDIKLFYCRFKITHKSEYGSNSSHDIFVLMKNKNKYTIIEDEEDLLNNEIFNKTVISNFRIKNDEQARDFERMLDIIMPDYNIFDRKHYKKDGVWCFVRNDDFGQPQGILVVVDKNGKIIYTEKCYNINESSIKEAKEKAKK